jgi:hypothetical protein
MLAMSSMRVSVSVSSARILYQSHTILNVAKALKGDVITWLDAPDPSKTHNRLLEEHHEGTGEWFLQSNEFETWMETPASALWIKGIRTDPSLYCSTDWPLITVSSVQREMVKVSCGAYHLLKLLIAPHICDTALHS